MAIEKPSYLKLEQIDKGVWAFNHPAEWEFFDYKFDRALEAERAGNTEAASDIYLEIISGCPDHLPSHNNLSLLFSDSGDLDAAISCFEETVSIGQACFPPEFDPEKDLIPWYYEDNRAFLLAFENLGKCYLEKAINTLQDLHDINPGYRGISGLLDRLHNLDDNNGGVGFK